MIDLDQGDLFNADRITDSLTHLEPSHGNAPLGTQEAQRFNTPVRISFHSVRKRLADIDGISGKAVLDGIVKSGLLQDDSPQFVESVSHSQEKGKEEITIVTIEPAQEMAQNEI